MVTIGKYLLKTDNIELASKAVLNLNRRKSLDDEGMVVVDGRRILFELVNQAKMDSAESRNGSASDEHSGDRRAVV